MKLIFAVLPLLLSASAMAMPHDQPELKFFSDKTVSVGLVFSEGTDSSTEPKYHRLLQEVYVCKDGKQIADFAHFKTIVDSSGYMIISKEKTGGVLSLENSGDGIQIMSSTLSKFKVGEGDAIELKLTQSGISGFVIDWSDPCAPKATDE